MMYDTLSNVYEISDQDLHIWLVDVAKEVHNLEYLSSILSTGEIERAKRFIFEKDRKQYIVAHGILRLLLARYLEMEAEGINFSTIKKGKPVLDLSDPSDYRFNMSHSNNLVIYAITRKREVGIDIEYARKFTNCDLIADSFFSQKEIVEYFSLPAELRMKAFYTCWTRKEAFIKAVGEGFYFPLDSFSVSPNPGIQGSIDIHDKSLTNQEWFIRDIRVDDDDYVSSVVFEEGIENIKSFNWN
jgi:4'-phosphopantetheinyl transferase